MSDFPTKLRAQDCRWCHEAASCIEAMRAEIERLRRPEPDNPAQAFRLLRDAVAAAERASVHALEQAIAPDTDWSGEHARKLA